VIVNHRLYTSAAVAWADQCQLASQAGNSITSIPVGGFLLLAWPGTLALVVVQLEGDQWPALRGRHCVGSINRSPASSAN